MRMPAFKSNSVPTREANYEVSQLRFPVWLMVALLALVTIAIYWPTMGHGFVYDDEQYVIKNPHVTSGLTLGNIRWALGSNYAANWHPVTWISHMVDCQLFGLKPLGHHLTNVLLHTLNTILVFLWLRSLTGSLWRSFTVAALFGWHPMHVESVAWVAERKDVLSTGFGLLALVFYARYARSSEANNQNSKTSILWGDFRLTKDYWFSLLFFVLGLMSKPMLVTWPFVLLLLDFWPLARFNSGDFWPLVKEKIPFFVFATAGCFATFVAQKHGGAVVSVESLPLGVRSGNGLISYASYLEKLAWPNDMAALYPMPQYLLIWKVIFVGVFLLGISALLFVQRQKYPFLLMGWLWYCGTLVPVIGLVQVGSQAMADRYTYIPSLGVFILAVWGVCELICRWRYQVAVLSVMGVIVIILCVMLTRRQIGYWQDGETLFQHTLAVTKDNSIAHFNLGYALDEKGQINDAISQYQEAIRLNPKDAEAHNNLGAELDKKGQTDGAINEYLESIRLELDYAEPHNNLGLILYKKGKIEAAARHFQVAIQLEPDFADPHYNLGNVFFKLDQIDKAVSQYQAAIRLKPDYAEGHYNLGVALGRVGQTAAAIRQYQEATRLKPDYAEAYYNLGNTFFKLAQIDEAINQFQEVIRLEPDNAEAHNNLGIAFYAKKRIDEAISQFREALRLKPEYGQAQINLERALEKKQATPAR